VSIKQRLSQKRVVKAVIFAPDENLAIATLLEDAARLATAANGKLGEALAIAERDAAFNADRQWFKSRPDRSFRARLATAKEIEDLHSSGAWPPGWVADESCFVYAVVMHEPAAGLETLYFVLPVPNRELREDELKHMWGRAAVAIARGTGQ
jgi:hypothetical protein